MNKKSSDEMCGEHSNTYFSMEGTAWCDFSLFVSIEGTDGLFCE